MLTAPGPVAFIAIWDTWDMTFLIGVTRAHTYEIGTRVPSCPNSVFMPLIPFIFIALNHLDSQVTSALCAGSILCKSRIPQTLGSTSQQSSIHC